MSVSSRPASASKPGDASLPSTNRGADSFFFSKQKRYSLLLGHILDLDKSLLDEEGQPSNPLACVGAQIESVVFKRSKTPLIYKGMLIDAFKKLQFFLMRWPGGPDELIDKWLESGLPSRLFESECRLTIRIENRHESLGDVLVDRQTNLEELRKLIYLVDTMGLPEKFRYLWNNVPVSNKQEKFMKAHDFLPSIYIRSITGKSVDAALDKTRTKVNDESYVENLRESTRNPESGLVRDDIENPPRNVVGKAAPEAFSNMVAPRISHTEEALKKEVARKRTSVIQKSLHKKAKNKGEKVNALQLKKVENDIKYNLERLGRSPGMEWEIDQSTGQYKEKKKKLSRRAQGKLSPLRFMSRLDDSSQSQTTASRVSTSDHRSQKENVYQGHETPGSDNDPASIIAKHTKDEKKIKVMLKKKPSNSVLSQSLEEQINWLEKQPKAEDRLALVDMSDREIMDTKNILQEVREGRDDENPFDGEDGDSESDDEGGVDEELIANLLADRDPGVVENLRKRLGNSKLGPMG